MSKQQIPLLLDHQLNSLNGSDPHLFIPLFWETSAFKQNRVENLRFAGGSYV